jgi:hypothetical protein
MLLGALISGILHIGVVLMLVFGLPLFWSPPEFAPPIPVELITLQEAELEDAPVPALEEVVDEPPPAEPVEAPPQEQAQPQPPPPTPEPRVEPLPETLAEPEPSVAPEPQPETEPEPVVAEAREPEPEPEPEPEAVAESEPETLPEPEPTQVAALTEEPKPEPEAEPEPEPEPEPEAVAEPSRNLPAPPRRKPQVQLAKVEPPTEEPEPEKPRQDLMASILKNVEKLKEEPAPRQPAATESQTTGRQASRIQQDAMVRAIQQRLQQCWRLEPGAENAENLVVQVTVFLNPDGSVRQVQIQDRLRMAADPYFRSAAENARRAILKCSPFDLPPREYFVWQRVNLNFDPRMMFGG